MSGTCGCPPAPPAICPLYLGETTTPLRVGNTLLVAALRGQLQGAWIQLPVTVGFVWSATETAPTLARNDGASVPTQITGSAVTGTVDFTYQLPPTTPPGIYYVRAYVVWPSASRAAQPVTYSRGAITSTFTVVGAPDITTTQAFVEVFAEGTYIFRMQQELATTAGVPADTVYTFLVSATNPSPTVGGDGVVVIAAAQEGDSTVIASSLTATDAAAVVYVRGAAAAPGFDPVLAPQVLTVTRVPVLYAEVTNVDLPVVVFLGSASYDVFPDPATPRVHVLWFGYIWTNSVTDPVPTLDNWIAISSNNAPAEQTSDYVPVFPLFGAVFDQGAGTYNCRAYLVFETAGGMVTRYSEVISTVVGA
jgi:hypothetical protein